MNKNEKLEAIAASLVRRLPEFELKHVGEIFDTGNRFLRFDGKGRGLRVEITRIVLDDFPAEEIVSRLAQWEPPSEGNVAVRVYSDRIEEIPWTIYS